MVEPKAAMERALEQAREAVEAGDNPYGAVLVYDDTVIASERNTVVTGDDITAHPELKLARTAARQLSPDECAATTMYTSTEPCPMCASAISQAGIGRVVYSASASVVASVYGSEVGLRAREVVDDRTTIEGPLLPEAGRNIHEEQR